MLIVGGNVRRPGDRIGRIRREADGLAMIAIDNAVELTMKTYLGLPKRITKLQISRKDFNEIATSFPALLDALERYASDKIRGIDLGEIEWYHRLRNELYHQGNGLTVEREKVEVYAELASILFKNLFDTELVSAPVRDQMLVGEFLDAWTQIEVALQGIAHDHSITGAFGMPPRRVVEFLRGAALLSPEEAKEINSLRQLRNQVVHGNVRYRDALTPEILKRVNALLKLYTEEPA
jgi:hypothetical protein